MPIYGLNYGTTPGYGSSLGYPSAPAGIPTGPVGTPALGTFNIPPSGGGAAATIPPFDPSSQIPGIEQITQAINQLNLTAQQAANAARIPNATGLETQSSNLIGQELAGKVPADVIALLQQQGAERGAATGMDVSSPNANAAYLRALGLTSLQEQQTGQANLTAALGRNPGAPLTDPSRFVMTPYQAALLALEQERLRLGYQPRLGVYTGPGSGGGGAPYPYTPDTYVPRVPPPAPGPNPLPPDPTIPPDFIPTPPDPNTGSTDPSTNYDYYSGLGPSGTGTYYPPGGGLTYPGGNTVWWDPSSDPFSQFGPTSSPPPVYFDPNFGLGPSFDYPTG